MSDDDSRRRFLKWLGAGAGASALGLFGSSCSGPSTPGPDGGEVGGSDGGGRDTLADTPSADSADDTTTDTSGDTAADGADAGDDGDAGSCDETGDDVEGPFHSDGAPQRQKLAPDDEPGERIIVRGTVYENDCRTPVPGAMLDVWHANEAGDYYDASDNWRLRGQLQAGDDGTYEIRTIKPGRYRSAGGLRPAHIHFTVSAPQFDPLTTQMYFENDPQLQNDPCGVCSSDDSTLIVDFATERRDGEDVLVGTFDIVLG